MLFRSLALLPRHARDAPSLAPRALEAQMAALAIHAWPWSACAVPEPFAWAGWARASCGSAILVDQTAEYLSSADRGGQVDHLTRIVDGRPLFPTLVWTVAVVMSFVASEHST